MLERSFDDLGRDGASRSHAVAMMYIASILYLKIQDYRNTYKNKEGKQQLREMLASVRRDLDALEILGLDAADEIGSISLTLSGAYQLIDRMRNALAAATDMPKEILFNESPAGLNAGQLSGPQELWFARVEAFQEDVLTPALNRILEVLFASMGLRVDEWTITWRPLWTKSETETATTGKTNAETDKIYFDMGAATAEEIRKHRFEDRKTGPLELDKDGGETPFDLSTEVAAYEQSTTPAVAVPARDVSPAIMLVEKVYAGQLPRDAGVVLLQTAGFDASLLGSAGVEPEVDEATPPSPDPPPGDLLSPRDAAAQYSVSTRTITRQIELGTLRYWGLGAHKRVSAAEVAALARAHEVTE